MFKLCSLSLFAVVIWLASATAAQSDNPTIAILRFGALPSMDVAEGAVLDLLESYGYLSPEENRILESRRDHQARNINIIWGDAGFDYPTISLMVEDALDQGADVLVTLGTPVTLTAVNTTMDMPDPPTVLFTAVHNPYLAGIAEASCIKPAHVTGSEIETSYEYVFDALLKQNPALATVGTIYDTAEASGVYGVDRIAHLAGGSGISVETAGVNSLSDLRAAADSLVQKGAGAIVLPIDSLTTQGLPIIVTIANENGIPVFHPSLGSIYHGATIGAGYSAFYDNGVRVGIKLAAHLNGDIDIASTAIYVASGEGLGINLDSASAQGVDISAQLMQEADVVLQGGSPVRVSRRVMQRIRQRGVVIPLEDRQAADTALLDSLQCTNEMIAEQQAALDRGWRIAALLRCTHNTGNRRGDPVGRPYSLGKGLLRSIQNAQQCSQPFPAERDACEDCLSLVIFHQLAPARFMAVVHRLADVEESGRVGNALRLLHIVRNDDDGVAGAQLPHQVFDALRSDGVQGGAGLVHQDHIRLDRDGPRDAEPLLLPAR